MFGYAQFYTNNDSLGFHWFSLSSGLIPCSILPLTIFKHLVGIHIWIGRLTVNCILGEGLGCAQLYSQHPLHRQGRKGQLLLFRGLAKTRLLGTYLW